MTEYPRLSTLIYLAFEINAAIDGGHDAQFSFQEIYQALDDRSLLKNLSGKLGDVVDLGIISMQMDQHQALITALSIASEAFRGRERRKVGVERSGLRLLMAIILEAIHQQNWTTLHLYPLSQKEVVAVLKAKPRRDAMVGGPLADLSYRWDAHCSKN